MRKGDERRSRILETAEKLFYQKGYEETSIQDILDELKMSKGGFYHHFESKLQLLEALCQMQMAENSRRMAEAVQNAQGDAVAQINALYEYCTLWQRGQTSFTAMVLRTAYKGGSVQLRDTLKQCMLAGARPLIREIVHAGIEQNQFFTRYPDDIGELLLQLFANLNDEIAMELAVKEHSSSMAMILSRLRAYRHAAEMLLGAPYGSMVLCDLSVFPVLVEELMREKRRLGI